MKKVMAILVAGFFLTAFVPASYAQGAAVKADEKQAKSADVVKGAIVSIDAAKNELVIKDEISGTDKTISVDPKAIGSLQVGDKVKAKLKAGTNKAESVRKYRKSQSSKK